MRAVVMTAPGAIEVTTIDDPTPRATTSSLRSPPSGSAAPTCTSSPAIMACSPWCRVTRSTGTVVAAGVEPGQVHVGDRVAVDPSLPCRACRFCRRGPREPVPHPRRARRDDGRRRRRVHASPGEPVHRAARSRGPARRDADRATVVRAPRIRRAAHHAWCVRARLRRRNDGAPATRSREAHRAPLGARRRPEHGACDSRNCAGVHRGSAVGRRPRRR